MFSKKTSKASRKHSRKNAIMSLCLVGTMLVTGAFAYLTDTDTATNVFTVGDVKIDLTEPKWDESKAEDIWAGKVMDKDPTITNTGDNESYVYAMVTVPKADDLVIFDEVKGTATVDDYQLFTYELNPGWTLIDSKADDNDANNYYLYAYDTALAPEGVTTPVFSKIEFANVIEDQFVEPENELDVIVDAYAIQSNFGADGTADQKSPKDAWNLYANQNGWEFPSNPVASTPDGLVALNFVAEDGDVVHTEVGQAGEPVEMYFDSSLAKTGYSFDWTDENGNAAYSGMPMPEEDTTLTATYTETGLGKEGSEFLSYRLDGSDDGYFLVVDGIKTDETRPTEATDVVVPAFVDATVSNAAFQPAWGTNDSYTNCTITLSNGQSYDKTFTGVEYADGDVISLPVTKIGTLRENNDYALIKTIAISDSVTTIGIGAFRASSSSSDTNEVLEKIVMPYGVTSIEAAAFGYLTALTEIEIPNSVTSIGIGAFRNNASLTSVTIPASVKELPKSMFQSCSALEAVILPEGLTAIGEQAFSSCKALASINLPDSITSIGKQAFYGNKALTSVVIPAGVTEIAASTFATCSSLASVTIHDGVTNIAAGAFRSATALTAVSVPSGCTVADDAFPASTTVTYR